MPITLRPLPDKFFRNSVTFYPAVEDQSSRGADLPSYPNGYEVKAVVQVQGGGRSEPDGVVSSSTTYNIFIKMSDYAAMVAAAGRDVAADDHFVWTDGGGITLGGVGTMNDRGGRGLIAWIQAVEIVIQ